MASAGYCPGTVVAEAGEAVRMRGSLGCRAYSWACFCMDCMPQLPLGTFGHVSVAVLCGANPWLVLLVFVQLATLTRRLTARV